MKIQWIGPRLGRHLRLLVPVASLAALTASPCDAAEGAKSEAEIRASAKAFVEAFNRGDAKAVAGMWTTDGTLVDETGVSIRGRAAIEKAYTDFLKRNAGRKIESAVLSVEFPAEGVAVEDGVSTTTAKSGVTASVGRYTAVHVLKDGKWLMASVREAAVDQPEAVSPMLELEWLIGGWQAKRDQTVVNAKFEWLVPGKFIRRDTSVENAGIAGASSIQVIGWDAAAAKIRSWSFDSNGGHSEGLWTPSVTGWLVETQGVLASGATASSADFLSRMPGEDRVMGWRSSSRMAGGEPLPDLPELVFDRVAEKK
jgi:uncharacterized protein (TIGR02246 family)